MATHPSILAWRIPWTEEPGRLQSIGLQRVWSDLASMHILIIVWHLKIVLFLECFTICPAPLTHWQVKDLLPNFIPQLCIFQAVLIHLLNRPPSALPVQTYHSKYTHQKSKSLEIFATEVIIFIWFNNWIFFFLSTGDFRLHELSETCKCLRDWIVKWEEKWDYIWTTVPGISKLVINIVVHSSGRTR